MEKKLKTLDEHNAEYMSYHRTMFSDRPQKNGIACPECGSELFDTNPMITLTTFPARKSVHCDCGYKGSRIC